MKTKAGGAKGVMPRVARDTRYQFFAAVILFCGVLSLAFIPPTGMHALAMEPAQELGPIQELGPVKPQELELNFIDFPAAESTPKPSASVAGWSYDNGSIRIEITEHKEHGAIYFTVELWLSDIMQLQSAFSSNKFDSTTETVKDIAGRHNAILAINGDFATFNNGGIIIRNGELYRANKSTRQLLIIGQNGDFSAFTDPPEDAKNAASRFLEQGVWHTCVFGPVLVENGQPVELPDRFFIKPSAHEPRTAIAQLEPLHYLMIIVDGRQDGYSNGITLAELRNLFILYGAETAFNLDGGGSTTLYFDGEVLNRPANGYARRVPDIFFIER